MNMQYIPQQPSPVFDDGQPENTMRAFRLPGTNLTIVVMVPPDMPPVVGISIADPGKYDADYERVKALFNALDTLRYRHKPGQPQTIPMPLVELNDRERFVMVGLRQGRPAKQIAAELDLNVTNIYRAIESVLKKTNSKTTEQAIYKLAPRWLVEEIVKNSGVAEQN